VYSCVEVSYKQLFVKWMSIFVKCLIADTDKWVCCRCVAELEANDTELKENVPLVVATNTDNKVDGNCKCIC